MSDDLFRFRIKNWEFGISKRFTHWWWSNGYTYEFLGYFWLFHYRDKKQKVNYNDGGYGLWYKNKEFID